MFITVPHYKMPVWIQQCSYKALCLYSNTNYIHFFPFPKSNVPVCRQWAHARKRIDRFSLKNAVICSKHFEASNYYSDTYLMQQKLLLVSENYQRLIPRLKPDAVPTLYLWGHEPSIQPKPSTISYAQ